MLQGLQLFLQILKSMVLDQEGTQVFYFLELPEIVPFTFGEDPINQGDFVQLTCNVRRGDKPLSLTWSLKGDIISSDPVLTTTMLGTQTSILMISAVDYQHSGVYTCRAENPAGITSHSAELYVNGISWMALNVFYLQKNPRLFLSLLDLRQLIKEVLLNYPVL